MLSFLLPSKSTNSPKFASELQPLDILRFSEVSKKILSRLYPSMKWLPLQTPHTGRKFLDGQGTKQPRPTAHNPFTTTCAPLPRTTFHTCRILTTETACAKIASLIRGREAPLEWNFFLQHKKSWRRKCTLSKKIAKLRMDEYTEFTSTAASRANTISTNPTQSQCWSSPRNYGTYVPCDCPGAHVLKSIFFTKRRLLNSTANRSCVHRVCAFILFSVIP